MRSFCFILVVGISLTFSKDGIAQSIGDKLATYSDSDSSQEGKDCYNAVYNRVLAVFGKNNKPLPLLEDSDFTLIWRSSIDKKTKWKNLDPTYKGCGPPGAMVSIDKAELINHKEVWEGKLKPGALIQVWDIWSNNMPTGKKSNGVRTYNAVLKGESITGFSGMGHAFIFIKYEKEGDKITGMRIADQGTKWAPIVTATTFGFWIGANLKD